MLRLSRRPASSIDGVKTSVEKGVQKLRILAAAAMLALAGACATAPQQGLAPASTAAFSFAVIGDVPYSDDDRQVFEEDIVPKIKDGGYPFVIHIGDYKSGGAPCTADEDEAQLALIETLAPAPVFYTPGDNEWTDCDRFVDPATGKPQSELGRLAHIRALFFSEPLRALQDMQVVRQAGMTENATWTYGGVRFATMHVVGTGNGRRAIAGDDPAMAAASADEREAAALSWLSNAAKLAREEQAGALVIAMHADMTDVDLAVFGKPCIGASAALAQRCDAFVALRAAMRDAAEAFDGPVLLIHGDTAPFTFGQLFAGNETDNLWILNAAGDHGVTGEGLHYGVLDSTLVTVTPDAAAPFAATGIATDAAPTQE